MALFKEGNKGRPKGSKNKLADREGLIELLNAITSDLNANYDKLNTNQKLKLLATFKHLYTGELTEEQIEHFRTIQVNIVKGDENN